MITICKLILIYLNNNQDSMKFKKQLTHGRLVRRYQRFLADVILDDGILVVVHCTNSGSMKSCLEENAEVWLSPEEKHVLPGR